MTDDDIEVMPPADGEFMWGERDDLLPTPISKAITKAPASDDVDTDYEYARENLKTIIAQGQSALEGVLELAKDTDHPRAYEVVGQILKNVADVNGQLMDLQKQVKAIKAPVAGVPVKNQTNAIFVGSTHELQKLIAGKLDPDVVGEKKKD